MNQTTEAKYKIGQELFFISDFHFTVKSFYVGAMCGKDGNYLYAPQIHFDHKWTSESALFPNAEEAIKNAIHHLKDQLKA